MARHGTRTRYMDGCRCDKCRGDQAAYAREWRAKQSVGPVEQTDGPGSVEVGVEAELAVLSSAQLRPGLVAQALELARLMDNPRAVTSKAPASRQLTDILNQLRKGADKKESHLASVRNLSREAAAAS